MTISNISGITSTAQYEKQTDSTNSLGQDAFLSMLVTQMKYQDPLEPMKNTDFTAQLAQFSSLEALTNIQDQFSSLTASIDSQNNLMTAALIGKDVEVSGDSIEVSNGNVPQVSFDLSDKASSVEISIYDSTNNLVQKTSVGAADEGRNSFSWDGLDSSGNKVNDGYYTFTVSANSSENLPVNVTTITSGTVTGVVFKEGKPYLQVGGLEIDPDNLLNIK
ncbi:MAG: hypothetical protein HZA77_05080 [Candidatus Schekmanbacteria bacterium]|nr:hypothetical protein [Candidatus Schekmanbacteria bacterium]